MSCLAAPAASAGEPVPVLVELFTSEGCSSCPSADAALETLARTQPVAGARIIPLELHVDYWNDLGWADPFSSPAFTQRQRDDARGAGDDRIYTPQMVVDGAQSFVGEEARAEEAVARAAEVSKLPVSIDIRGASVVVQAKPPADADVWLAVTEGELVSHVPRGENAGRTLRHAAVVRRLERLSGAMRAQLAPDARWNVDRLDVVAWIQERSNGRVLGVAARKLK